MQIRYITDVVQDLENAYIEARASDKKIHRIILDEYETAAFLDEADMLVQQGIVYIEYAPACISESIFAVPKCEYYYRGIRIKLME